VNQPASTLIATCFDPSAEPGSRRAATCIVIRRDNHRANYSATLVDNRIGEHVTWHGSQEGALAEAASRGFTEVSLEG
jgi:hypothetical protein